jgi:hypothetical protein
MPSAGSWQGLVIAQLRRVQSELHDALGGQPAAAMTQRVAPSVNPIGWLAWHLTRSHDRNLSEIADRGQLWIEERWHRRFGLTDDPTNTGFGHTAAQVAAFAPVDGDSILAYHDAVVTIGEIYLATAPDTDLVRVAPSPTLGTAFTVQERLVGVLNEAFQHLGQIRLTH